MSTVPQLFPHLICKRDGMGLNLKDRDTIMGDLIGRNRPPIIIAKEKWQGKVKGRSLNGN